jgi:hypothetical protein
VFCRHHWGCQLTRPINTARSVVCIMYEALSNEVLPLASDLYQVAGWDTAAQSSIELIIQGTDAAPSSFGGLQIAQPRQKSMAGLLLCPESDLAVQSSNHSIGKLPQLARRQLRTLRDIRGLEAEQVVGSDQGLVERGQQM